MSKKLDERKKAQELLESKGTFDGLTEPINSKSIAPVDKDFVYIRKGVMEKFFTAFSRSILYIFSPIVNFFAYKFRIVGKENLHEIKNTGAFSISNHVCYLDNLMLRQSLRGKRMFFTVGSFNNKKGYKGLFLRTGGALPLSDSISGMKNFNTAVHTLVEDGKIIHFYAEQAMWVYYEKPRPFKKGAFRYSAKEMKPILPMFISFSPSRGWRKLFGAKRFATMHIMPPIYPKQEFSIKENCDFLQAETQKAFILKYREVYGDNNEIIYNIDESAMPTLNQETLLAVKISKETCPNKK